jgi:hypothetical protein
MSEEPQCNGAMPLSEPSSDGASGPSDCASPRSEPLLSRPRPRDGNEDVEKQEAIARAALLALSDDAALAGTPPAAAPALTNSVSTPAVATAAVAPAEGHASGADRALPASDPPVAAPGPNMGSGKKRGRPKKLQLKLQLVECPGARVASMPLAALVKRGRAGAKAGAKSGTKTPAPAKAVAKRASKAKKPATAQPFAAAGGATVAAGVGEVQAVPDSMLGGLGWWEEAGTAVPAFQYWLGGRVGVGTGKEEAASGLAPGMEAAAEAALLEMSRAEEQAGPERAVRGKESHRMPLSEDELVETISVLRGRDSSLSATRECLLLLLDRAVTVDLLQSTELGAAVAAWCEAETTLQAQSQEELELAHDCSKLAIRLSHNWQAMLRFTEGVNGGRAHSTAHTAFPGRSAQVERLYEDLLPRGAWSVPALPAAVTVRIQGGASSCPTPAAQCTRGGKSAGGGEGAHAEAASAGSSSSAEGEQPPALQTPPEEQHARTPARGRAGLGVTFKRTEEGAYYVKGLSEGSRASQSALSVGDWVLRVDGHDIHGLNTKQLTRLVLQGTGPEVVFHVQCADGTRRDMPVSRQGARGSAC